MGIVNSILNYIYFFNSNCKQYFISSDKKQKETNEQTDEETNEETKEKHKYPDNFFCPICLNTLNENDEIYIGKFYIKFDCNHYIHFKCLRDYIFLKKSKLKCPMCRSDVSISKETFESNIDFFNFYYKIIYYKEENNI
jgi:hypothetical protein